MKPHAADRFAVTLTFVDDEPCVLDILVRASRIWKYTSQAAASAEEAVALLERQPTPVVVTDLQMPGRGGVWLVHEIRRRWPQTAVIVLTAGSGNEAAIQCLNAGAQRYFLKPVNLDDFRHALAATLHTYELERERERYREHLERTVRRQTRKVRRTFLSAIDSLVRTLEARDPYTTGHSLRVRQYALLLAESLGLDDRFRRKLSLSAKLHDIGKVGVPEAVLHKPGRLTRDEYEVIQQHPAIGERILSPIIRDRTVLAGIRSHHERLDGQGYPDRLRGDGVPLIARVIAVADCYDALTSSRAYRAALSPDQALDILLAGSGTQFEPELVRRFADILPSTLPTREELVLIDPALTAL